MNNTSILDDQNQIQELDQDNLLGGAETLADQILDAWSQTEALDITPPENISQVVVAGMGGSGLGADIAKSVFHDRLTVPIHQVQDYTMPGWVNEQTLVIAVSFSGTTEEIVSAVEDAQAKGAQLAFITAGGKLLKIAQQLGAPTYQMKPEKNPSPETRVALGYSLFGLMGFMAKLGVLTITKSDIDELVTSVLHQETLCQVSVKQTDNPAKTLAFELLDRRPVLVGAEHLSGVLHTAANILNENAKTFAEYRIVPEMNHHLMEGLMHPKSIASSHLFLFFNSELYHPQNKKRMPLTAEVVENNELDSLVIEVANSTPLTQVGEVLTLMAYTAMYLAILEKINPGPLPNVDWFKSELKQR